MWKMGACIALSAAMMLTSVGGMLPSDWGIETVYADETQTTTKTFTAEQLEVEGCSNQETDPDRYYLAWQDFRISPMGANLQLIFFKNGQGEVIVKLLHNENEVKLPIDSPIAPYYQWEAVKAFYNHL